MDGPATQVFQFGDFYLDATRRVLLRAGTPVPLTPKALETLTALVRRSGRVVGKDELLREIWPDTFVEEATLAQNIFTLRKALGEGRDKRQYIQTVPKQGYRFVAEVREFRGDGAAPAWANLARTQIAAAEAEATTQGAAQESPAVQPVVIVNHNGSETSDSAGQIVNNGSAAALVAPPRKTAGAGVLSRPGARRVLPALLALPLLVGAIFLFRPFKNNRPQGTPPAPAQKMRVSRLTNTGRVRRAAISPDGKYIVYAQDEGAQQSLWLRQVTAPTSIPLRPAAPANYRGLTFAPDGSAIYYVVYEQDSRIGALYRVQTLGGVPQKIISDVDSSVSFAPDARRFAFLRFDPAREEGGLFVANADGTGEQKLVTRAHHGSFTGDGPAWSPDGKVIICPFRTGAPNRSNVTLIAVGVQDGAEETVTTHRWESVGQPAWLPDGSGVVMDAWDESVASLVRQIWQVSYPGGDARLLANDLNSYQGLSMTAGAKTLVTVLSDRVANFWVAPRGETAKAVRITSGTGDKEGEMMGLSWTHDNRIVYGSTAGGQVSVWVMDADGRNQKQLTTDAHINFKPAVAPDGRAIVFVSRRAGAPDLWQMDVGGDNVRQLTSARNGTFPDLSPDGRWVVYNSIDEQQVGLWKMALAGGAPVRLTEKFAFMPKVSPDGRSIACFYQASPASAVQLAVIPFDGGEPLRTFDLAPTTFIGAGLRWLPDGSSLTYVNNQHGVSNIFTQPLAGGPPRQLTGFTSDQIFRFAWSPDGKRLALERGFNVTDVILISDFD